MGNERFTIFEHGSLIEGETYGEFVFTGAHLKQLLGFFKEKNFPYYTILRNGVRFCEYVGVIQVGKTIVEVLPKADTNGEKYWRRMLFDMLCSVGLIKIKAPSFSNLNLRSHSILDLYFDIFLDECEVLLHRNLIKKYRSKEGNVNALKGSILFSKHIKTNLTHQERFYTRHTVYDNIHPLNCVLYKTILLLNNIIKSDELKSKIGNLILNFPEMPEITVNDSFFSGIQYNRKIDPYRPALEIARLILLNYHPDVNRGSNNVLAIMFNMNDLWEKFVIQSLRNHCKENLTVEKKLPRNFWSLNGIKQMYPDIVITEGDKCKLILDTKWKNIEDDWASDNDLRQMFTYSKFYDGVGTALVYPGQSTNTRKGFFMDELNNKIESQTSSDMITIGVKSEISQWQIEISKQIETLIKN